MSISPFGTSAPQEPTQPLPPVQDAGAAEPAGASTEPDGGGRRRRLLLAGLGALALVGGGSLALLLAPSGDEEPLAPVTPPAASPAPETTATPTAAPSGPGAVDPAGTAPLGPGRNLFAALVAPDDAATGGVAGATSTAVPTSVPTAVSVPPLSFSGGGTVPASTSTVTVTSVPEVPATGLTALWAGTSAGQPPVAELLVDDSGTPAVVSVAPGGALGTEAPLSWVVSEGLDVEGRLVLRAGDVRYRLVQGTPQSLF